MTTEDSIVLKKICLWSLNIACGLVTACIGFISVISVWVGVSHGHEPGFWVPVFAGTLLFFLGIWVFLRITKRVQRAMKEEDVVKI